MYRIRLASGEEAVYKTVEELAQAVSSGVISPTAEVFHKAGNRWLPINTHPDYRTLVTARSAAITRKSGPHSAPLAPPATPASPASPAEMPTPRSTPALPSLTRDPFSGMPVRAAQPEPLPAAEPEEPAEVQILDLGPPQPDELAALPDPNAEVLPPPPPRRRSRRPLAIALAAGTVLLVSGGVVLYSAASHDSDVGRALPERADGMAPAPTPQPEPAPPVTPKPDEQPADVAEPSDLAQPPRLARPDTVAVEYPAPSRPLPPASPPARSVPPAPRVVSRLGTTVTRMPSYFEAYADARAEMDEGLDYVNFRRIFAPVRFASPDSVRSARRTIAAAVNILRVYRGREVMLEQTYRPGEPEGRGSLREPFEVAEASRGLLSDIDSLFAILVAQEGEVRYRDNALYFLNGRASRAYSDVRRRITQELAGSGDPVEAADRVTMPRLLRAVGPDRPPPAH